MRRPRTYYFIAAVYAVIGIYFLLYSDFPLFIILFAGLAVFNIFLGRTLTRWVEERKELSEIQEIIDPKLDDDDR